MLTCKGSSAATVAGGHHHSGAYMPATGGRHAERATVRSATIIRSCLLTVLLSLCVPAAHSRYCSSASACPAALPPPLLLLLLFWPLPPTGLLTDNRLVRPLLLMWWLRFAAAGDVEPAAPAAAAAGRAGKPACPASRRGHSLARSSALTRPLTAASLRSCVMSCRQNRTADSPARKHAL
jgi:hypothetical protein